MIARVRAFPERPALVPHGGGIVSDLTSDRISFPDSTAVEPYFTDESGNERPSYDPRAVKLVNAYFRMAYADLEVADQSEMYYSPGKDPDRSPPIFKFPKRYVVYVLGCESVRSAETITRRAERWDLDISDNYVKAAVNCPFGKTYVGCTHNLYRRLGQHMNGVDGAYFTQLFPPKQIKNLTWFDTREEARVAEKEQAKQLHRDMEFVYPSEEEWVGGKWR